MACIGNYLRVRGEYNPHGLKPAPYWELPPRTRRIRHDRTRAVAPSGTTSAYAENTPGTYHRPYIGRNYLRVRGEYPTIKPQIILLLELPPRTRRILGHGLRTGKKPGTTSAYAENTGEVSMDGSTDGNYLRVRGEYQVAKPECLHRSELPPRTRRILIKVIVGPVDSGTTSAYAENTPYFS